MTWLEIEYLTVFSVPDTSRTEYLTAVIPTNEKKLIGIGNTEGLHIGFLALKLEEQGYDWIEE